MALTIRHSDDEVLVVGFRSAPHWQVGGAYLGGWVGEGEEREREAGEARIRWQGGARQSPRSLAAWDLSEQRSCTSFPDPGREHRERPAGAA